MIRPLQALDVKSLIKTPPAWIADRQGPLIAVSSRVRLARNLEGAPFPARCSRELRRCISLRIREQAASLAWLGTARAVEIGDLDSMQRDVLMERRMASRELCNSGAGSALVFCEDGSLSLMINEEDHLRIQALRPGLALGAAWDEALQTDAALAEGLPYSFDDTWGYLTSCPTNVGTGLRASVMLHLPALGLAGMMEPIVHAIRMLGFEVRGALGEGTEALASLYQVSNQSTLGESEADIIGRLEGLIGQLIWHEKNARLRLTRKERRSLYDTVGRAYGILRHSYTLTTREALNGLSALRLGVDLGLFSTLNAQTVDRLFLAIQPGHLQWQAGGPLSAEKRDERRAGLTRAALAGRARPAADADNDAGHNE